MCGIAGIFLKPERRLDDLPQRLQAMASAMAHRGPDDEGIFVAAHGRFGCANRRLAIRDLSPAGHMPMTNPAQTVWITYNGEVYNAGPLRAELERAGYGFRSTSDTEVILRGYEAWGAEVAARLRGMFAFAIWDERAGVANGRVLLARDHMGIKPLYYAQTAEALVFASELKALHAAGLTAREMDPAGLVGYLLMGSVPNPLTIYADVRAMPPASLLQVSSDGLAADPVTYWQLPEDIDETLGYDEAVGLVADRLGKAVQERLVSDVPLGAFLSGGLDSSSVVALMRQATAGPIRTCSMVFAEEAYSEALFARAVADACGTQHYERVVTSDDLKGAFDYILAAMDQPTIDGVNTYFVSQTAREAGLTVALSGLGGDELFGGYPNTFGQAPTVLRALELAHRLPGGVQLGRAVLDHLPRARRQQWARVRDALAVAPSPASAYLTRRGLFSPREVQALVAPDVWMAAQERLDVVGHVTQQANDRLPNGRNASEMMAWISRAELRTYTHHQLLRDTDVMSMAHSLEVRVPLLDVDLVETALRLPAAIKLRSHDGQTGPKPLLTAALGDALPPMVRQRRDKQGFTFPFDVWLRGPLAGELLRAVPEQGLLQAAAVGQLAADFENGRVHWSRPWALMALAASGY